MLTRTEKKRVCLLQLLIHWQYCIDKNRFLKIYIKPLLTPPQHAEDEPTIQWINQNYELSRYDSKKNLECFSFHSTKYMMENFELMPLCTKSIIVLLFNRQKIERSSALMCCFVTCTYVIVSLPPLFACYKTQKSTSAIT